MVTFPVSDFEEEGLYYILAKASLRKLMMEVADTVGLTCKLFKRTVSQPAQQFIAHFCSPVRCSIRSSRDTGAPEAGGELVPAPTTIALLSGGQHALVRFA